MVEVNVGIPGGHIGDKLTEAVAGGVDHVAALVDEALHSGLSLGGLGHIEGVIHLVASVLQSLEAQVHGIGKALGAGFRVEHHAHVDLVLGQGGQAGSRLRCCRSVVRSRIGGLLRRLVVGAAGCQRGRHGTGDQDACKFLEFHRRSS